MYNTNPNRNQHPACDFVPGFAFYEGIGNRLAELFVDLFDAVADLAGRFRI